MGDIVGAWVLLLGGFDFTSVSRISDRSPAHSEGGRFL